MPRYRQLNILIGLTLLGLSTSIVAETLPISNFSTGELDGWEEKSFAGNTLYKIIETPQGKVLHASTEKSASGLFKTLHVDLTRTPYMHWSWRVDKTFNGNDEHSKEGDDYPARVYVVIDGGMFFWRTRAVNYVWSSNQPVGTNWPNAFTGNARMVAVRSGTADSRRWVKERRNVLADLKHMFGEDITHIDAVAVMTDSDNTEQGISAMYGDIYFSSE